MLHFSSEIEGELAHPTTCPISHLSDQGGWLPLNSTSKIYAFGTMYFTKYGTNICIWCCHRFIVIPSGPRQPTSKAQVCLNVGVMRSLLLCWAFWSFGGRLARAKNVVFLEKNRYFSALGIIHRIGRNLKDAER